MLLANYCFGIRSERRMCEEVHLNLFYRWFCRLGLDSMIFGSPSMPRCGCRCPRSTVRSNVCDINLNP